MPDLQGHARGYPVTIVPDPHEGFVALIPDFPAIYTNGDTPEEALRNAYEGIALALEWHAERGTPPPVPSVSIDAA